MRRNVRALLIRAARRTRTLQDRLLHLLGSSGDHRGELVSRMLERNAHEATAYWLQLGVSIGIATLGLVVGSAAVIIGAMLVAPLMGPIIALAMGLATGSPYLVLRSASRIVISVAVAIGGAALITVLLPFHELNSEIAARTSPTVLDLLTAGFCALAGVYAALRPGSDTATTAAGTSIGISLVPPLCASGYGLGTAAWPVAGGAALLFLTNLVAIVFVGTVSFVAAGFNRAGATALERQELAKHESTAIVTAAVSRRLAGLFESKAGPALRLLMPLVLLAAVYVPLARALDEVAWQVRTRALVQEALGRQRRRIVQSRVRVERHEIEVVVVMVGKTSDAETARTELSAELHEAAGVVPRLEVLAIPDATAFAGLESSVRTPADPLPLPPPVPPPSPSEQLEAARALVRASVAQLWPTAAAGQPLVIELGAREGPLRIHVIHLGRELGPDAIDALRRSLRVALEREVELVGAAIPAEPLTRAQGDFAFVARVTSALELGASIAEVAACVVQPPEARGRSPAARRDQELAEALHAVIARYPRVTLESGSDWSVRFVRGACPHVEPPPQAASTTPE